jgi:hypothetical protein
MNSVPQSFGEWMSAIQPDERFALCVVAIIFGVALAVFTILMISLLIRSIHYRRTETAFKRELLDRGLSVDEIAKIVQATPGGQSVDHNT